MQIFVETAYLSWYTMRGSRLPQHQQEERSQNIIEKLFHGICQLFLMHRTIRQIQINQILIGYSIIYDGDDITDTISTVDLASKYQVIGIEYIDSVNKQVTVSVELCSVIEKNRIYLYTL